MHNTQQHTQLVIRALSAHCEQRVTKESPLFLIGMRSLSRKVYRDGLSRSAADLGVMVDGRPDRFAVSFTQELAKIEEQL